MGKLSMCRICLVENVRMHVVTDKSLQELYEKLTDIPFVTEDNRPMLACFICYAMLKQCCQFQRKCLQAEELFARMLNENYEQMLSMSRSHSQYLGGFVKTAIENISIVDAGHTESEAIEIELPALCERQYNVQVKEEPSDEVGSENPDNMYADLKGIPLYHSKSDSEDDVHLMEFKIEVEEEQKVCEKERSAWEIDNPRCYVKKELKKMSPNGGDRRQDEYNGADVSPCTIPYEMKWNNLIEEKRKVQNKMRCQRYREKKKNNTDTLVSCQTKHNTITAEEEETIKRRKEYDKEKSKRYRDRKRQSNIINLNTEQYSKTVNKQVTKCKNVMPQIASTSTTVVPYTDILTRNKPYLPQSESEDEIHNDTSLQVNYVPQILEPVITIYVPNTQDITNDVQNNTQLIASSDGGKRGQGAEADVSASARQNEMILKLKERTLLLQNEIKERKKILNKIRCQRYRDNKKRNADAIVNPQLYQTITAEEEEKIRLRKEYDKEKSKRYRDKKRANRLINNLHTDRSTVKS